MPDWFLLDDLEPFSAAENMARDEYLFIRCRLRKCGFLRLYSWAKPSFSFGVNQKISRALNLAFIRRNDCAFVRRITGGKTVLHDHEITYALVSSEEVFFRENDLTGSYLHISRVIMRAFQNIGVKATMCRSRSSDYSRTDNPCFSFPTLNEIEIQGKKIVGSAQKRDKKALLQHGSIPITMNYKLYARGAHASQSILESRMTTLSDVTERSADDFRRSLIDSFEDFIGIKMSSYHPNKEENHELKKIAEKYQSPDWNFYR